MSETLHAWFVPILVAYAIKLLCCNTEDHLSGKQSVFRIQPQQFLFDTVVQPGYKPAPTNVEQ